MVQYIRRAKKKTKQTYQSWILYPAKLSLKIVGEIKTFPDKWKLRKSVTTGAALQEMLKEEKEMATHSSILPGKIHGQRSLACWSPWDYMTEHVCTRVEGDGLVAINW